MKSSLFTASSIFILPVLLCVGQARGQVVNDNIEDRLELFLDKTRSSNTSNCTLQWECINKKATGKCIQYHNDQWFFFKNNKFSKLFLNISGQVCRDLRGVQIVVIDGAACAPQSYKIIKCISLGDNNDIFVELDNLDHNKTYLVQIDGYLHDFCAFDIELSSIPKGIPLQDDGIAPLQAEDTGGKQIKLQWTVVDSIATQIKTYEIWRRHESNNKSKLVFRLNQEFNAYGNPRLVYSTVDSLQLYGTYYYHIVGVDDQERILISKNSVHHKKPQHLLEKEKQWLSIKLDYPDNCKLKISLFDTNRRELLNYFIFLYSADNQIFETYIKDYLEKGITDYRLQVEHLETGAKQNFWIEKKRL